MDLSVEQSAAVGLAIVVIREVFAHLRASRNDALNKGCQELDRKMNRLLDKFDDVKDDIVSQKIDISELQAILKGRK